MKTMKLFSMAALALAMAACSNNDDNEIQQNTQQPGTMHFTATIAAPSGDATTRTVYTEVGTTINVIWEVGDQIALVHNGVVDVAEVKTVDNVTGNATIEATITGSPSDNDDVYLAYPADAVVSATPLSTLLPFTPNPAIFNNVKNNQDGTLAYIQDNLDLRMGDGKLAVSGSDVTLKGSVSVSSLICIWKLTLQDESSNALSATKLTFKKNTDTQAGATSTGGQSVYYLCVVPSFIPAASGTYSFVATVGSDTYTFSKTGLSLDAGKYYQSTVTMAKVKPDLLSGVFSVSSGKKVKFSKGNLRYASGVWSFFDNQYDYYTTHDGTNWDKFGWSTSATTYGMNTSIDNSTYSGSFVDWGATMGAGWFTLSKDEWTYLLNTRSASTVGGTADGRYAKAKVNDVQGMILFPDTYTPPAGVTAPTGVNNATTNIGWYGNNYSSADWTKMESAGCVFLPAAGYRYGSSVNDLGTNGYYWSATPSGTDNAYYVYFNSGDLNPAYLSRRCGGNRVRLVRQVTE